MINVALVGGSGFIGSNLARLLSSSDGYQVNSFDLNDDKLRLRFENKPYSFKRLDIRDLVSELDRVVADADVVVNLAAHVRPGLFLLKPLEVVDVNFFSNIPIIEVLRQAQKIPAAFFDLRGLGKNRRQRRAVP